MYSLKSCLIFMIFVTQRSSIYGQDITKSSLTFVIDDTGSMGNEIRQVKESVNSIFDAVVNSNTSQIENFILVSFNDPGAQLLTNTTDRYTFKSKLQEMIVDGGGDCAEYAMKGIKIALENSLPFSYLYVFTDASAKDHNQFEEIKRLSQKKQIEVTFLLTGICGTRNDADYQVYKKLANATSGEVFHMNKDDVKDVITFIKDKITERSNGIFESVFPPGKHTFTFVADSKTNDIVISVSGLTPKIQVINPDGEKVKTERIVDKFEIGIVKITEIKPGVYTVEVDSASETSVKVTGKTAINFEHGFSSFEPTSLNDTATRPAADGNTHLSIQLRGEGVNLTTVELRDESGEVLNKLPLRLINNKTNFYVTEPFDPPKTVFRISVSGYDEETNTHIDRLGTTPIERIKPTLERSTNLAPVVTIDGGPIITMDYNAPLQLKCKVHGYPKPTIIWQEKDTGIIVPAQVFTIEEPYDYISILNKEKLNKNSSYECTATNPLGEDFSSVAVQTNTYFIPFETPNGNFTCYSALQPKHSDELTSLFYGRITDTVVVPTKTAFGLGPTSGKTLIEYDQMGIIPCKVNANPPATITWYKDEKLLSNDTNIIISNDKTAVTIQHMDFKAQGKFTCEVENELQKNVFYTNVVEFGSAKPEIDETVEEIRVKRGEDVQIACRILKGSPKPTIQWYFQAEDSPIFVELIGRTTEILKLRHVVNDHMYKCIASNAVGHAEHHVSLIVEYAPEINVDGPNKIQAKDGKVVTIPCVVDGVPRPVVKWFVNGTRLYSTKDHRLNKHGLRFHAIKVSNAGNYTCTAENRYGSTEKTVIVDVIVPANIEVPSETHIEATVGENLILPCRADGYPEPEILWLWHSYDRRIAPKYLRYYTNSTVLGLPHAQLKDHGYYTCIARNIGEPARLTYNVTIHAPPKIENEYPDKTFKSVKGDLALRIPCSAIGNPKPVITWRKNNLNVAFGADWYEIEDGTLIIKNIDDKTSGTYTCVAQNKVGNDTMAFNVTVTDYPSLEQPATTKFVEIGKPGNLKCDIPHNKTDLLRWYKNEKLITTGELSFKNVTPSDKGIYSCRVSNLAMSSSAHVNLTMGQKPYFLTDEEEVIDFVEGDTVSLCCEAGGDPAPKVSWWLNGEKLDMTDMMFDLEMMLNNRGIYTCEVSNDLGSIQRSFNIVSKDCILDVKQDFLTNGQSLMLSPDRSTWASFEVIDGYMIIKKEKPLDLHCPNGFLMFPSNKTIVGYCESDTNIVINGNILKYAELKCRDEAVPIIQSKHTYCLPGNTEYLQIGYNVEDRFLEVYEVCVDKDNNVPLYTQHKLSSAQYNVPINVNKWFGHSLLPLDFDTMYDCVTQVEDISSTLGKPFHSHDHCCYDKRQLVNPKDLRPGIPPAVAYSYLNVVPHWSTCNSKNWAKVEDNVRNFAKYASKGLIISTGTAKARTYGSSDIKIHDARGTTQPVAESLWKVVQDPVSKSSLAIIQVNVPDLRSKADARKYVYCRDICSRINWMKNRNWHNVADGYTYCCSIDEFESAFDYRGQFSGDMTAILNTYRVISY